MKSLSKLCKKLLFRNLYPNLEIISLHIGKTGGVSFVNFMKDVFGGENVIQFLKINVEKKRTRPNKSEVINLKCNNNKILKNTSWKPKTEFSIGLDKTIEWFKDNRDIFDTDIYHV